MNKLLQHYQGKMISRVVYITRELGQVALILFLMKFLFVSMEWNVCLFSSHGSGQFVVFSPERKLSSNGVQ